MDDDAKTRAIVSHGRSRIYRQPPSRYLLGTACGGEKRGLQGDVRLVIYDVSKMSAGWIPTLASADAVCIAARRLIEHWLGK